MNKIAALISILFATKSCLCGLVCASNRGYLLGTDLSVINEPGKWMEFLFTQLYSLWRLALSFFASRMPHVCHNVVFLGLLVVLLDLLF